MLNGLNHPSTIQLCQYSNAMSIQYCSVGHVMWLTPLVTREGGGESVPRNPRGKIRQLQSALLNTSGIG